MLMFTNVKHVSSVGVCCIERLQQWPATVVIYIGIKTLNQPLKTVPFFSLPRESESERERDKKTNPKECLLCDGRSVYNELQSKVEADGKAERHVQPLNNSGFSKVSDKYATKIIILHFILTPFLVRSSVQLNVKIES